MLMSGGEIGSKDGVEDNRCYPSNRCESICAVSWNQSQHDIITLSPSLESFVLRMAFVSLVLVASLFLHGKHAPYAKARHFKKNLTFSSLRQKS